MRSEPLISPKTAQTWPFWTLSGLESVLWGARIYDGDGAKLWRVDDNINTLTPNGISRLAELCTHSEMSSYQVSSHLTRGIGHMRWCANGSSSEKRGCEAVGGRRCCLGPLEGLFQVRWIELERAYPGIGIATSPGASDAPERPVPVEGRTIHRCSEMDIWW